MVDKPMTVGEFDDPIDVLNLSTKTKNNLKYLGYKTIRDLKNADLWHHPKFHVFSTKLRSKIELETYRFMFRKINEIA